MKNSLEREIPDGKKPFISPTSYAERIYHSLPETRHDGNPVFLDDLDDAFKALDIKPGMTISFHHHLRNGDHVLNKVAHLIEKHDLHDINLAPSSVFPEYDLVPVIEQGRINDIYTSYLNGPVAQAIQKGFLKGNLIMQTHGGRARSIEEGELKIDVAFLACPSVDRQGNGSGAFGKSACGALGYGISDLYRAKKVVLVTDNVVDKLEKYQFDHRFVDYVVKIDSIGNPEGIVSGTTRITRDPIGLKIARDTSFLLERLNVLKNGVSLQTGAGGTSLAVMDQIGKRMAELNIKGNILSGGITSYHVKMLEAGLFKNIYDVQCFDLEAVRSFRENAGHIGISASEYANPFHKDAIVDKLDAVILGATEIDLDFNVNVTTNSFGSIIGGSGGHADTAHGAKVTIITSPLARARIPLIKEKVTTVTTPGEDIDILITERGIAVNPRRKDLLDKLTGTGLPVYDIEELMNLAHKICGKPMEIKKSSEKIGYVEYRDGTVIDSLYRLR